MIPKLDIVIVNWNSGNLLSECVSSISSALHDSFNLNNVFVIDNASSDDSLSKLNNVDLPLTIIINSQNLGFAKACNQGAVETTADYLLFLNPDTRLFSNSLSVPINFLNKKENELFAIAGIQLRDENNEISRNCARFPSAIKMIYMSFGLDKLFSGVFPTHFMIEWDHAETRIVDQVMGSFFMIRRSVFEKLGGYDERFFVYYEDLDLAYRASKIGRKSIYLANASIYHKGGGTSEKVKATRLFYILRSKLIFAKKHFNVYSYFFILFFTFIPESLIRITVIIFNRKIKNISDVITAYYLLTKSLIKK